MSRGKKTIASDVPHTPPNSKTPLSSILGFAFELEAFFGLEVPPFAVGADDAVPLGAAAALLLAGFRPRSGDFVSSEYGLSRRRILG